MTLISTSTMKSSGEETVIGLVITVPPAPNTTIQVLIKLSNDYTWPLLPSVPVLNSQTAFLVIILLSFVGNFLTSTSVYH